MSVTDERIKAWYSIVKAHDDVIADAFDGRRLQTARSIYHAIVRLANDGRAATGSRDVAVATRRAIADASGSNPRTVDEYGHELERLGVLRIERTRIDGVNLPNRWILTSPPANEGGGLSAGGGDPESTTLLSSGSPRSCSQVRKGGEAGDTLNEEELQEAEEDARTRAVRFAGRNVSSTTVVLAVSVVEQFNELAGTAYRPFGDDGKPSENLKRVVGAVLRDQRITLPVAEQMIRAAFAGRRFWEPARPHLGHVFGPGVVEAGVETALRAAGMSASNRMALASRRRNDEAERAEAEQRAAETIADHDQGSTS
jgi:hypothetical protein